MGTDEARENRADNYREEAETTHGGLLLKVRGGRPIVCFIPEARMVSSRFTAGNLLLSLRLASATSALTLPVRNVTTRATTACSSTTGQTPRGARAADHRF